MGGSEPTPSFLFVFIELVVYAFAIVLAWGARTEKRWLSTLFWGMAFGTAVELLITHTAQTGTGDIYYSYGRFLVNLGRDPATSVPLWVGVGWGCIVFAATWTSQRLELPRWLRPFAAGLLAVNIDFTLDPIAQLAGFWHWFNVEEVQPKNYYGVPFDNYAAWFVIVSLYAFFVTNGFRVFDRLTGRPRDASSSPRGPSFSRLHPVAKSYQPTTAGEYVVPPVAALLAAGSMALIRWKIGSVYGFVSQSTAFFALFLVSLALTAAFAWHARRDASPNWAVLAIPLFFHVFAGIALCLFPTSNPTLLVAVPAQLLFGLAAYSWPSLDKLLPMSPRAD